MKDPDVVLNPDIGWTKNTMIGHLISSSFGIWGLNTLMLLQIVNRFSYAELLIFPKWGQSYLGLFSH